jgi:hypothetical protein
MTEPWKGAFENMDIWNQRITLRLSFLSGVCANLVSIELGLHQINIGFFHLAPKNWRKKHNQGVEVPFDRFLWTPRRRTNNRCPVFRYCFEEMFLIIVYILYAWTKTLVSISFLWALVSLTWISCLEIIETLWPLATLMVDDRQLIEANEKAVAR